MLVAMSLHFCNALWTNCGEDEAVRMSSPELPPIVLNYRRLPLNMRRTFMTYRDEVHPYVAYPKEKARRGLKNLCIVDGLAKITGGASQVERTRQALRA